MTEIQIIQDYENSRLIDTGVYDENYIYFFHELVDSSHDNSTSYEVLKYDYVNKECISLLPFEKPVHGLHRSQGKKHIYYSNLEWNKNEAIINIYQIDCEVMRSKKVYTLSIVDMFAKSEKYSSIYRYELFGIDERYLLFGKPELNPSTKLNSSGFSEYILIDILDQKSYSVPEMIGLHDTILHLSYLSVFECLDQREIIIETGRIAPWEKKQLWTQKKANMSEGEKNQSVVVMPLDIFIDNIKKGEPIQESYIIQKIYEDSALIQLVIQGSNLKIYKGNFLDDNSEIITYSLIKQQKTECVLVNSIYYKLFFDQNEIFGLKKVDNSDELYYLKSDKLIYSSKSCTDIYWASQKYIITRQYLEKEDLISLKLIDLNTEKTIHEMIGNNPNFSYIPSADILLFS